MAMRDLIPWNRARNVVARSEEHNPFLTLHREVNRLFDDVFRSFDLPARRLFDGGWSWPTIEVSETDRDLTVTAELPGLDEKDVQVELADGVLVIRGEKRTETEEKDRLFSERYYGRFERRIPVDNVDEGKVSAAFKKGVLTVTLPKLAPAQQKIRRIPVVNAA